MHTRKHIRAIPLPQSTKRRPIPRKDRKPRRNQQEVTSYQQPTSRNTQAKQTRIAVTYPTATPVQRPRQVPPTVKPSSTSKGRIPPYNPNTVQLKTVRMRKQPWVKQTSPSRKTRLKPMARTLLYAVRLLIVGVGIGAIVGTVLSVLDPATRIAIPGGGSPNADVRQPQSRPTQTPPMSASGLYLSQENISLKSSIQSLALANPNLGPGVFLVDLENGSYVDVNGSAGFSAASTIKIPILVAFFQDVDAGKIRLDETLTMEKEMMVGGSGDMQYKPVGTQFSALEVATKMMTISDNTATNMLIARLGGMELLNQRFRSWGLTTTALRNPLPDLQGTNTTSPKELSNLMVMVSKGNLVSMPSRDRILSIMRNNTRNHLLPTGLGAGATIAHKTGDIGTVLADAGIVDIPTGKRYVISVMVQRPNNDPSAEKLISSISREAYQQLSQPTSIPSTPGSTLPTTGYQSPVMNAPLPNNVRSTVPTTGYPSPVMNPTLPNNMGSTVPNSGYQQPVLNQQYYYSPYQR
ncbi:MAG: serine hydrolase [Scytonema sp. PMC 1069.18]|nr:serine hydrolase [Scytonema sp. PMC 1069.18]MEC4880974.1 serine hydrolase [Scytonema sp. PMC 1070.18]